MLRLDHPSAADHVACVHDLLALAGRTLALAGLRQDGIR
jgi:hypothetical protein